MWKTTRGTATRDRRLTLQAVKPHPTDAQRTDGARMVHAQADRLTAQAAATVQHATTARATTARLAAQADEFQQRADRLHAQADPLLHPAERTPYGHAAHPAVARGTATRRPVPEWTGMV